jgi:hypothetical protein
MRHFKAARLALSDDTSKALERFEKEGFDVVGLKPHCLYALHFLANAKNAGRIHGIMG